MYQIIETQLPVVTRIIKNIEKNATIPQDPANTDYQAYLAWLAEGNTPLPADQPTE